MRGVKRVVLVLIVLVVALAIVIFALENQQDVVLTFLGMSTPHAPVSVFVTLALIVGMLIGPALGLLARKRTAQSGRAPKAP